MTKLSQDASQLQLLSPLAPSGGSLLKSPSLASGDQAFSAFRAPDTVARASATKKRATRDKQQQQHTAAHVSRTKTLVGGTPRPDSRPSPAPSPAVSHPDAPVDDALQLDTSDGPELRSSKKRGFGDSPPGLMRSLSSSDSDGGFHAGERPSPLCIPSGLDSLLPPRAAESPVLPQGTRPSFIDRAQDIHGLSLDDALLSDTSRSLCNPSALRREEESAVLSRSVEFPRSVSEPAGAAAAHDGSSGKRFRQTVCDSDSYDPGIPQLLTSSAQAETPLPDMTPRAKLLPVIDTQDGCQCIDGDAVEALIAGTTGHDAYHIIDCRFPFEHEGGCINSPHTHNIWDPAVLEQRFFPNGHSMVDGKQKTAIVFHCEFSSKRAPKMCKHLRTLDRQIVPTSQYPHLCYPEMYILKSGYKKFVETHTHRCRSGPLSSGSPLSLYTEMLDKAWGEQFRRSQSEYQAAWKKLNKRDKKKSSRMARAASFESSPQSTRAGGGRGRGGAGVARGAGATARRGQFRPIGAIGFSNHGRARLSLGCVQDGELAPNSVLGGPSGGGAARGMSFASMDVATDTPLAPVATPLESGASAAASAGSAAAAIAAAAGGLFAVPNAVLRRSSTAPPTMETGAMMASSTDSCDDSGS